MALANLLQIQRHDDYLVMLKVSCPFYSWQTARVEKSSLFSMLSLYLPLYGMMNRNWEDCGTESTCVLTFSVSHCPAVSWHLSINCVHQCVLSYRGKTSLILLISCWEVLRPAQQGLGSWLSWWSVRWYLGLELSTHIENQAEWQLYPSAGRQRLGTLSMLAS